MSDKIKRFQVKTFTGLVKYIRAQASDEELAASLGVSVDKLISTILSFRNMHHADEQHVRHLINTNRELGKLELREALFKKALDGDKDMLKFLAKNNLGMSESPNDDSEESKGGVVIYLPDNGRDS